jgi:acyl homoserine lactone synthase
MILVFQGRDRKFYANETDQMFRLRADVFAYRLGWDVRVQNGWEIDEYDDMDPMYVLSMKEDRVVGCARFLPTTGPTLLTGAFASTFDESVDVRSPTILECTRLAVVDGAPTGMTSGGVCKTLVNMMMAGCELMLAARMSHVIGIFDAPMLRIYRRIGWLPEIIAHSKDRRKGVGVGVWEVNKSVHEAICRRHGLCEETVPPKGEQSPHVRQMLSGFSANI